MLKVNNLTKKYGDHIAVDNLSFLVEDNQIFGFLGPNGAGKSTTMNIISGCLSATSGTICVNDIDIFSDSKSARRCIGYLPEIPPLYPELNPYEFLDFVAEAKGISSKKTKIMEAMELTGITDMKSRNIGNLSKGFRQRVGLAQAILGDPRLLILDEPTVGLDPQQIIDFRTLLSELGKKTTILFSSHILSEVSAVCSNVLIISNGHFIAQGSTEELLHKANMKNLCTVSVSADDYEAACSAISSLKSVQINSEKCIPDRNIVILTLSDNNYSDICSRVSEAMLTYHCPVVGLEECKVDLEKIYLELTQNNSYEIKPEETEQ